MQESEPPGWPEPASTSIRMMSTLSSLAIALSWETSILYHRLAAADVERLPGDAAGFFRREVKDQVSDFFQLNKSSDRNSLDRLLFKLLNGDSLIRCGLAHP